MAQLKYKERIVPKAGRHLVELLLVEETENKFYDPEKDSDDKKNQNAWIFGYVDSPEMEIRVWSTINLSSYKGQKSKALTIVEALLDKELTAEDKKGVTDTNTLLGKKCFVTVKHVKAEDGQTFAKVILFESETGKTYQFLL